MFDQIEELPVSEPPAIRVAMETAEHRQTQHTVLDWLLMECGLEKPGNKLQSLTDLDSGAFVAEVKRVRGKSRPLTAVTLQALRDEHTRSIEPARTLAAEARQIEVRLSDLVNQAYDLTPEEVALMWRTAPPRMPIPAPN